MKKVLVTLFSVFALSAYAFASGFQINEHNARVTAMGGAFVGLANNASAIYYNPAGITQLNGTYISLGTTIISPSSTFTGPVGPLSTESKLKSQIFTPSNFYFSQSLGSGLYVGLGFNDPFGLGTTWEDNWVGRYRATETEIQTFNFSPVVAYKVSDQLSVSAGLTVSYANVLIGRMLETTIAPDAKLELKGNNTAIGYTAGILYKPTENLGFGAAFHSQIKYDMKGDATTTLDPTTPASIAKFLTPNLPKGSITAPLTTPMVITVGGSYKASSDLTLVADFEYTGWSSYDKLTVTFKDFPTSAGSVSESVRDYQNVYIIRGGAEYMFNESLALRGGLFYDKNPVKDERLDPTLPDADRIGLNIGLGYSVTKDLSIDLSYMFLKFSERTISTSEELVSVGKKVAYPLNGTYKSSAHLFGVNFNYNF
ncbi:MAG: OmpP1/FadL family transporter [Syntrophothermus sp.]